MDNVDMLNLFSVTERKEAKRGSGARGTWQVSKTSVFCLLTPFDLKVTFNCTLRSLSFIVFQ